MLVTTTVVAVYIAMSASTVARIINARIVVVGLKAMVSAITATVAIVAVMATLRTKVVITAKTACVAPAANG